ncbi:MAG: hypothetical protein SynsKO_19960 [Synoicihabitans sp.]
MTAANHTHRFSGWARVFEGLLGLVFIIGSITCAIFFAGSVYLLFADRIPDFMGRDIVLEMDAHIFSVAKESQRDLPIDPEYVEVELTVPTDEPRLLLSYTGTALIGFLIGLAATFHLFKFVRSLRQQHPFVSDNARRLRCVAWLMLIGSVWQGVAKMLVALSTTNVFSPINLNVSLRGDGIPLVTILMFFIIAEVFALGVKMKEDADLTV